MSNYIRVINACNIGSPEHDPSQETLFTVGQDLLSTFGTIGFVYLKNHGIPEEVKERAFEASRQFFQRERCYKDSYQRFLRSGYNGYTAPGEENTGLANSIRAPIDNKECFDVLAEQQCSGLPSELCSAAPQLSKRCCLLVERLLAALDTALSAKRRLITAHSGLSSGASLSTLRLLYYPPVCPNLADQTKQITRCAPHTDYGSLTLLFQDQHPGLQVLSPSGTWMKIKPLPDHLLINIGDMMEVWTGGRLKATYHRVTADHTDGLHHSRLSMAFFVHPDQDIVVSPLDGENEAYKSVFPSNYLKKKFAATYPGYHEWSR